MRVVLTGGASGGHLVPFEPIVDALRSLYQEQRDSLPTWIERHKLEIYFLGILDDQARAFCKRLGITAVHIPSGKLRRYPSPQTVSDMLFRLPLGMAWATFKMWQIMPDVVISKGGYGSVPVALAAVLYRIPFLLHESDAVLGLANQTMARWASVITVGFASAREGLKEFADKTIITGTPVRSALTSMTPAAAKAALGFPPDTRVLLIMGGSQGAQQLNDVLTQALPALLPHMGIIHLTGPEHLSGVKEATGDIVQASGRSDFYKPFGYITEQLPAALGAADVVVTRAGATSLAELARLRKAMIIVPLDSAAQDHQRKNAETFIAASAARVIDPANLGRSLFIQNVRDLIDNNELRETLENNVAQLDHPQAARDMALLAIKMAQGLVPRQPTPTPASVKKNATT